MWLLSRSASRACVEKRALILAAAVVLPSSWPVMVRARLLSCMQALKQYKQDHPERWDRVANAVDGKSKAACRARYKELRESFRSKKS